MAQTAATTKTLTRTAVLKRTVGLDRDRQQAMVCALVGHSKIHDFCFGYHSCARCRAMLGDSLAGAYKDDSAVYPAHLGTPKPLKGCHCAENVKTLTWRDTLYTPLPTELQRLLRST